MLRRQSSLSQAPKVSSTLVLAVLAAMFALLVFACTAFAQGAPDPYDSGATPGDFCVDDTGVSPLNCTANDTRVSKLTPTLSEVCLAVGDTATADFTAYLVIGATTRYDMGMYVSTDGTSAETGSSCYKTVLQPVASLNDLNTPISSPVNPLGTGPFKNEDGDLCGEANSALQADPNPDAIYKFPRSLTITCTDANNDGVIDPISTCLSWANNNSQYVCMGVSATVPGPGTGAKCNCQDIAPEPPILLYRGYDYGDLPQSYGTLLPNGPRHAIQDSNADGIPNTQGGKPAVWLGPSVDFSPPPGEMDGLPSTPANGDDLADTDDENGVTWSLPWTSGADGGSFQVQVNSSSGVCAGCRLGYWIDWDNDGDFADVDETYVANVSDGSNTVYVNVPSSVISGGGVIYMRFRLYDGDFTGTPSPTGLALNGEVEDYYLSIPPLGVTLADFYTQQVASHIRMTWETSTELENLGFNLYRGMSADGWDTQLNAALIPSQSQGSPVGFIYTWDDRANLIPDTTYYYWLEDVDLYSMATMHGPVSVDYTGPTAVTVSSVNAQAAGAGVPAAGIWLALLAPLAGVALAWRRRLSS